MKTRYVHPVMKAEAVRIGSLHTGIEVNLLAVGSPRPVEEPFEKPATITL
jgi:hypothetical protein